MITTGIIKEINLSSNNHVANKYLVELNLFQQPGDANTNNYTLAANACVNGGINSSYKVGDKVFVSFLHEDFSYPIILGHIYQGIAEESRSYASLDSLTVENDTVLSKSTTIGDISYETLSKVVFKADDKMQSQYPVQHNIKLIARLSEAENSSYVKLLFSFINRVNSKYTSKDLDVLVDELIRIYQIKKFYESSLFALDTKMIDASTSYIAANTYINMRPQNKEPRLKIVAYKSNSVKDTLTKIIIEDNLIEL